MIAALPSASGASDDVRSYDLVWTLHLVGDLHQPLHAVNRFTSAIPKGDAGGNAESVAPASGGTLKLHAYWDRLLGGSSSPSGAVADASLKGGLMEVVPDAAAVTVLDPELWAIESEALAVRYAYAPPVIENSVVVELTPSYEREARRVALAQGALAAARLANILKRALK